MSGFTFDSQMIAARYASAIQYAILTHDTPLPNLSNTCPECGEAVDGWNTDHVLGVDGEDNVYVIIGCEGYWVIDPIFAGITMPNWQANGALGDEVTGVHDSTCNGDHADGAGCAPQPRSSDSYPACTNPECDYRLCFMERRDLDECPACSHEIPVALRLNDTMDGPRS